MRRSRRRERTEKGGEKVVLSCTYPRPHAYVGVRAYIYLHTRDSRHGTEPGINSATH